MRLDRMKFVRLAVRFLQAPSARHSRGKAWAGRVSARGPPYRGRHSGDGGLPTPSRPLKDTWWPVVPFSSLGHPPCHVPGV